MPEKSQNMRAERGRSKLLNADPVMQWVVDFIKNGGYGIINIDVNWRTGFPIIPKKVLVNHYYEYCKNRPEKIYAGSETAFHKKLQKTLKLKTKRAVCEDDIRERCYVFEAIDDCINSVKSAFNGDDPFFEEELEVFNK
jgi:hypothetical protein